MSEPPAKRRKRGDVQPAASVALACTDAIHSFFHALDAGDADVELRHELDGPTVERALAALKAAIRDREQALDRIFEIAEDEARATDGDCMAAEKSGYADFDLRPPIMEAAWSES